MFIPNVCAFAAGWINISLFLWTTGNITDTSPPIKFLHKCCNKEARILPKKVKDEQELENAGLFSCMEPEDSNSHGVVLRDITKNSKSITDKSVKTIEEDEADKNSESDEERDEAEKFDINIEGAQNPIVKSRK